MNKWSVFLLVLFALPVNAEKRCMLQVAFDGTRLSVVQLCSATREDADSFPLPLVTPYQPQGPQNPRLPVLAKDVQIQAQGCKAELVDGKVRLSFVQDNVQVQISYNVDHQGRDWFVVVRNTSKNPIEYQVVTRRTTTYTPIVRPLSPYQLDEEEDIRGAWIYMTLDSPLMPGRRLVVSALNPPDRGFVGGWGLLGLLLVAGIGLVLWREDG